MSLSSGRYLPPHLRNRPQPPAPSEAGPFGSSPLAPRVQNSAPSPRNTSQSRTPWAASASSVTSSSADQGYSSQASGYRRSSLTPHDEARRASSSFGLPPGRDAHSAPTRSARSGVAPTLHVFGDSFTGPLKLLSEDSARVTSFKGASAKGLNNPNSIKQVSNDLVPALNSLLAPPPYAYTPSSGRWALLIFGNVDLQINYLWQLQHKHLSASSFPSVMAGAEVEREKDEDTRGRTSKESILATATENTLQGPALGPELFVLAVANAFTAFLEREIVKGPVGQRLQEAADKRRTASETEGTSRRLPPPSKVLIAATLPPLVEDHILSRIPEKYVERLGEEHEKAQRMFESGSRGHSRLPPTRDTSPEEAPSKLSGADCSKPITRPLTPVDPLESGTSTLQITDTDPPVTSKSDSSVSSRLSSIFEPDPMEASISSTESSHPDSKVTAPNASEATSIDVLLQHEPPLCTLPVRISMTNAYNDAIRLYSDKYPDIFTFIDISHAMLSADAQSGATSTSGAVDRASWACPVDPTNIHPLWEPTLPLWLSALGEAGVPTDGYAITKDAEDTFKAYEADKRRRTAAAGREVESEMKLREE